MSDTRSPARINVRLIVTIVLIVGVLGVGAVAARKIRSSIIAKNALAKGNAAFERSDWELAAKELRGFRSHGTAGPNACRRRHRLAPIAECGDRRRSLRRCCPS